jgi:acetylornithine deacetylase/succinyl-diaminopimelate desuccinylase-like protein
MDTQRLSRFVARVWDDSILPALSAYIRIPNQSPAFDPDWQENGHMERAAQLLLSWVEALQAPGVEAKLLRLPGRAPLLWVEVDGQNDDRVLMYGHFDKQPAFEGWQPGLSAWQPVLRGRRLYGRGSADDGYALFSALSALLALREQGVPHARTLILIEGSEESGSPDLPAYVAAYGEQMGSPSLVICLDAECGDSERLWCTSSLRGYLNGTLSVEVLQSGVHSGVAAGLAPSTFFIACRLLARLEDPETARITHGALGGEPPDEFWQRARATAEVLGDRLFHKLKFAGATKPLSSDLVELVVNNTWRPALSVIGAEGLPAAATAGNVFLPKTTLKLSFRLSPNVDAERAASSVKQLLEENPPYSANVCFQPEARGDGWNGKELPAWLAEAIHAASRSAFGGDPCYWGEGGSIPFIGMLARRFPEASFVVSGALGPDSNAHGPNEYLDLDGAAKVTECVAQIVAAHAARPREGVSW